jgi:hypothetical protein
MGSWTSVGTSSRDLWFWQWGGQAVNDTSISPIKSIYAQVGAGDGTNMKICYEGQQHLDVTENCGKDVGIIRDQWVKGGSGIYVREAGSGTADVTPTTAAYGLGG